MGKYKVVVAGKTWAPALERLQEECELKIWDEKTPIPRDVLFEWLADAEGLFTNNSVRVDAELLEQAPNLRVIAQASVGYDNVDVAACTERGIPFGNTPGVLVETTADLAFGLLLTSARRIHEGWELVKSGKWGAGHKYPFGLDLNGKTLGIIGMGQIGVGVARRAQASGMKVTYYNRTPRQDDAQIGATYVSFDELLRESDAIVVLVPLSEKTVGLFGREQFAMMKPTSHFVNAARGKIVDTDALYEALRDGQIAYAAMDVTDPEPLPGDHKLLTLPNILITPHVGSATVETRTAMALMTAENLIAGLQGKPMPGCVNQVGR